MTDVQKLLDLYTWLLEINADLARRTKEERMTWSTSVVWMASDIRAILEALGRRPRTHPKYTDALLDVAHSLGIRLDLTPQPPAVDASYRFAEGDALRTNEERTDERRI